MAIESLLSQDELETFNSNFSGLEQQRALELERALRLIFIATNMALQSAFETGIDMPVGAVVSYGNHVLGKHMASDRLLGSADLHAEKMAILAARAHPKNIEGILPDTLAVNFEPCPACQDYIACQESIQNVVFNLSRQELEARKLVRSHGESIFERAERVGLPYTITRVDDPRLTIANQYILDETQRDKQDGKVHYRNPRGFARAINSLNNILPGAPRLYVPDIYFTDPSQLIEKPRPTRTLEEFFAEAKARQNT